MTEAAYRKAVAVRMVCSKCLARRLLRLSQAKVHSTPFACLPTMFRIAGTFSAGSAHRRGWTTKPV